MLVRIWISVSHSSASRTAQSESGSFDVICTNIFRHLTSFCHWLMLSMYRWCYLCNKMKNYIERGDTGSDMGFGKHLENLGPEEFLVSWLHEHSELYLVGARSVDCHLIHVTVHLNKKLPPYDNSCFTKIRNYLHMVIFLKLKIRNYLRMIIKIRNYLPMVI